MQLSGSGMSNVKTTVKYDYLLNVDGNVFDFTIFCVIALAWRRGIVVIASAYRTEDPGFQSREGVRFLGINALQ
jgi:hypothetical protein